MEQTEEMMKMKEKKSRELKNALKANIYWLYISKPIEDVDKQIDNVLNCICDLIALEIAHKLELKS